MNVLVYNYFLYIERLGSFSAKNFKLNCKHLNHNFYDLDCEILFDELKIITEIFIVESKLNFD